MRLCPAKVRATARAHRERFPYATSYPILRRFWIWAAVLVVKHSIL